MASKKHQHKYYRAEMDDLNIYWKCGHSSCNHHMPKHYEKMLIGRNFICFNCGNTARLTEEHLKVKPEYFLKDGSKFPTYPICEDCILGVKSVNDETIDSLIKMIGKSEL